MRKGPMTPESLAKRKATIAKNKRSAAQELRVGGAVTGRFSSKPPKKGRVTVAELKAEVAQLKSDLAISHKSLSEVGARMQDIESGWNEFKERWLPKLTRESRTHSNFAPNEMPNMGQDGDAWGDTDGMNGSSAGWEPCNYWPGGRAPTRAEAHAWLCQHPQWSAIWPGAHPHTPGRTIAEMSDKHVRNSLALLLRAVRHSFGEPTLREIMRKVVSR